ncbi:MAG: hypothetical protein F4Y50_02115 [Dehalococcoidia bacterium]|nr:hypothetical protein [Dehalococcoidia bacterium]
MTRFSVEPDRVDLPSGATAGARRTWIKRDGRPIAALSQNAYRAYIYPLFTPSGVSVTAESPIDHPHHNSVTIGADHFDCLFVYDGHRTERGTYNFYVNETFQGRATGRIEAVSFDSDEIDGDTLRIIQRLEWQGPIEWGAPERRVLAGETRTIDIRTTKSSNILDIRSRLEPTDWDIVIGPTRHAYFTVRMADGLRVVDGGKIVDADGNNSVQEINEGAATWVTMSATGPHRREVGVTVAAHPSPLPTGWYAHEWGTVAINPFLHQEQSIKRGEALELNVSVAAHDGPLPLDMLDSVYDVRDR